MPARRAVAENPSPTRSHRSTTGAAGGIFEPRRAASEDAPTSFARRKSRDRSYAPISPATGPEPASPSAPRRDRLRLLRLRSSRSYATRAMPDVWRRYVAERQPADRTQRPPRLSGRPDRGADDDADRL